MTKKNLICALCSAGVALLLPLCAVLFVPGDSGMMVCFMLFFLVDPLFAIGTGIFAGKHIKVSWFQPLLFAALFLLGAWGFFSAEEPLFLSYAGVYLALGYIAAAINAFLNRHNG